MQLPKNLHQRLAEEFRFIADKMHEENDPARKLYLFSGMYGEANRLLNWTWDRDLVLLHNVLQNTHQLFSGRLQAVASGDRAFRLSGELFELLTQAADDLAEYMLAEYMEEEGQKPDLCELLGRFAELSYATTGNGNYLSEKGLLKL